MKRLELPNNKVNKFEIWLNKNCNFNCLYCGVHDNSFKDPEPDYEKISSYFPYIEKDAFITILGGEPTLSKYLEPLVDFLKNNGFTNINIYSNFNKPKIIQDVKYLVTYHPDQTDLKTFLNNVKEHKDKIKFMMIMWNFENDKKIQTEFKILKSLFPGTSLEPTYQIDSKGNMQKDNFNKFQELGLTKYSKLLTLKNEYLGYSYTEILNNSWNTLPKKCNIKNEIIIFDVVTNERYNCCTESGMKRKYNTEIQYNNGYCITECSLNLEHLIEIK
jgi:organic radical activating enzyme